MNPLSSCTDAAMELARLIGRYGIDVDDDTVEAELCLPRRERARCTYTSGTVSLRHTTWTKLIGCCDQVKILLYDSRDIDCGTIVVNTDYITVVNILTWTARGRWCLAIKMPEEVVS